LERSCLITEEIAGATQADKFCEAAFGGSLPREKTAEKRRLIRAMARLARRLHAARLSHRDFYLCHILVRPGGMPSMPRAGHALGSSEQACPRNNGAGMPPPKVHESGAMEPILYLIDLQRVTHHRRGLGRRWIVKDLAALLFSSWPSEATHIRSAVFTRTDGLRFAREYFGVPRLGPEHKAILRSVLRKARRIAARQARRAGRQEAKA
jgi:heptose I phosphotransferase